MERLIWEHNGWFGPERTRLYADGTIDRAAIEVFTTGHCHSLVLALRELTGWPIVQFEDEAGPAHFAIKSPDGAYIDIQGRGAEAREARLGRRPARSSKAAIRRYVSQTEEGWRLRKPRVKDAMPFAARVLQEAAPAQVAA